MGTMRDLSDFNRGMIVGARHGGSSISGISALLRVQRQSLVSHIHLEEVSGVCLFLPLFIGMQLLLPWRLQMLSAIQLLDL